MKVEIASPRRPDSSSSNQDYDDGQRSSARKRPMRNMEDDEWIIDTPRKKPQKALSIPLERKPPTPKTPINNTRQLAKPVVKIANVQVNKVKPSPQLQPYEEPNDEENSSFERNTSGGKKTTTKIQKMQVKNLLLT